jgi:hypothetical protein
MSGTGKSSVIRELAALRRKAIDTDDGWCEHRPGGRSDGAKTPSPGSRTLTTPTCNPYGTAPGDMDRILGDLAAVEPRLRNAAHHEIRTTTPLTDVVAKLLHLVGLSPNGYNTPEPRRTEYLS